MSSEKSKALQLAEQLEFWAKKLREAEASAPGQVAQIRAKIDRLKAENKDWVVLWDLFIR